jgi:hypothetical protein
MTSLHYQLFKIKSWRGGRWARAQVWWWWECYNVTK